MASSPPDTFFRGYPQNLLMSIFDILIGNDLNTDKGEVGDLVVQVHLGPPILSSVYAVISAFSA